MGSSEAFQCGQCLKVFERRGRFNQHMNTHTKPYPCDKCKRAFGFRADLTRHENARHRLGNSMHPCPIENCVFKATRKDNLPQHIRKFHSDHKRVTASDQEASRSTQDHSISETQFFRTTIKQPECDQLIVNLETFMRSVSIGNISLLKAAINIGFDISVKADDGSTALHCAVKAKQVGMVRYLLETGALLEVLNNNGRTPLHEAVLANCEDSFAILLQSGAKLSPLVWKRIIGDGQTNLLTIFCDIVEDPEFERHKYHIFESVLRRNAAPCLEIILSRRKIDHTWLSTKARRLLRDAVVSDRIAILQCLLQSESLSPNKKIGYGTRTLLYLAAEYGRLDICRCLLACKSIDVYKEDSWGDTAMKIALRHKQLEVVRMLLEHTKTSPGYKEVIWGESKDENALNLAIKSGQCEVLRLLISHLDQKKVPISLYMQDPFALVRSAVYARSFEMFTMVLFRLDTSLSALAKSDKLDLMKLAAKRGHLKIFHSLLENFNTDFQWAVEKLLRNAACLGHWRVVDYLLDYRNSVRWTKERCNAIEEGWTTKDDERVVSRLLNEEDTCLDWSDGEGNTLLHRSVGNFPHITAILLAHKGVQINRTNRIRNTALHVAYRWSRNSIIQLLLMHPDIDINIRDYQGYTALHLIAQLQNIDGFNLLCQHKDFDINVPAAGYYHRGKTALQMARRFGRSKMVELLLAHGAQDTWVPINQVDQSSQVHISDLLNPETNSNGSSSTNQQSQRPESLYEMETEDLETTETPFTFGNVMEVDHYESWGDDEVLPQDGEEEIWNICNFP